MIERNNLRDHAIEYAVHNWPVFPLRGKIPAIPKDAGGRGVLDATTDIAIVTGWWGGRYAGCNIGGRIPESMIMIDTDPYHGGLDTLAELERRHGPLPATLTDFSGHGDGGAHYFFRRPPGKLIGTHLGAGIDLKTSTGYGVLPPSIHPDTGRPYTRIERPVAAPPDWLISLLRPEPAPPRRPWCSSSVRRWLTNSPLTPPGLTSSSRTAGAAPTPDRRMPTVPAGCTPPRHHPARPPSATGACSCGQPTPCSTSPNPGTRAATPDSAPTRCSTSTGTCRRLPEPSRGWRDADRR